MCQGKIGATWLGSSEKQGVILTTGGVREAAVVL